MLKSVIAVGTGSCIGGILRYLISLYSANITATVFPIGTLVVNVTGCFIIGLISGIAERSGLASPEVKLFLTVGLCGGFTTFSTFMNEVFRMVRDGHTAMFLVYITASIAGGYILLFAGHAAAKLL